MWNDLTMQQRADVISMAVKAGMRDMKSIRSFYDETSRSRRFEDGGSTKDNTPGMAGMMKATLATAAHFGNPTARRMTNYDTRSYTWPNKYIEDGIFIKPKKGNVYVASYDNLVTPQIQDTGNGLTFVNNVWSPENEQRSYSQSLKFNNEEDARYFGEHYKEIAPMMHLYEDDGHLYAGGGHIFDGKSEPINVLYKPKENVVHRVTRVNGDLVGMDPDTGRFYDNTTGNYIGDHVALEDTVITPQNGTIDDMGNIYQNIGGVTHMTTSDGRHIILGEKPVSNVDPVGEFYVEGTALSPLFKPMERVVSGILGAPEIVKSGKEILSNAFRRGSKKEIADLSRITAENAASMTPEQWTAAQDAAIARGDMAEAQRLRNLHGAVNDYHSGFYHETKEPFVKFNRPGKNSTGDLLSPFGVFTKRTNKSIGLGEYQMPLNVRYNNPLHVKDKKELFEMLPKDLQKEINTLYRYQFHNTDQSLWNKRAFSAKQKIGKFLEDNNYDALIIDKDWAGTGLVKSERWTDATIVPSPGRVKSADAVTFDDNGVRIPLGKRDNFNINDIRYGLLPFGIGLTGLGLVNEE